MSQVEGIRKVQESGGMPGMRRSARSVPVAMPARSGPPSCPTAGRENLGGGRRGNGASFSPHPYAPFRPTPTIQGGKR